MHVCVYVCMYVCMPPVKLEALARWPLIWSNMVQNQVVPLVMGNDEF